MAAKPYWIKQRYNPQIGTYYVACGRLGVREAKKKEGSLYGSNTMLRYETVEEYQAACAEFGVSG